MARRGPEGGSSRRRRAAASSRRRSGTSGEPEKKERSHLGPIPLFEFGDLEPFYWPTIVGLGKAAEKKGGRVAGLGQAAQAIGRSPEMVARHPKAAVGDINEMVRGLVEAPPAIYRSIRDVGAVDTGSMLLASIRDDYKARYGADWKKHSKDDPLFNFLDAFAVIGAGLRGASLGKAFSELGQAGVSRSARNVWKESSRPGLLTEGMPRGRELTYELEGGKPDTSFQPYSRSPTRRAFQDIADELAYRYPTMPMMGVRSRVARATSRELIRDNERLMGSVADPHAVQALSRELKTRLFWGAQIGDHSTSALREFRDLLKETIESGDLPADPEFAETVREARKRGFGKQMIRRIDEALEVEPGDSPRYQAAIQSMRDMTALSERTIKDADGFQGRQGDLKRAQDRMRGLGPDHPEYGAAAQEVQDLQRALAEQGAAHDEMFRNRRNRIRDWRDQQRLLKSPERIARLAELTQRVGKNEAEATLALYDALAHASGDALEWYRKNVKEATGENVGMVMRRADGVMFQPGRHDVMRPLGWAMQSHGPEGQVWRASKVAPPFFSPLQHYVLEEMPPGGVQARQLPGVLKSKVSRAEIEQSGIDQWIKSFPPEQKIPKSAVIEYLSNPANSFNLEEIHRSSKSETWKPKWREIKGLSAVTDQSAEYHQIVFRMADPARGHDTYRGKGIEHWGAGVGEGYGINVGPFGGNPIGHNIIGHLRFHIVTEKDGSRTLVVEEAQSDWLSDWGKQEKARKKREAEGGGLTPEQEEFLRRNDELTEMLDKEQALQDDLNFEMQGQHLYADEPEWQNDTRELQREYEEHRDATTDFQNQLEADLKKAGYDRNDFLEWVDDPNRDITPPPPITKEMLFSLAAKRIARFAADEKIDRIVVPDGNVHRMRYKMTGVKLGKRTKDPRSVTRALRDEAHQANAPTDMFKQFYDPGRGVNKALTALLGKEGIWDEGAFQGRYADEDVKVMSKDGDMPGTVFDFSREDRALYRKTPQVFKQQPVWNELPRGALELLGDGEKLLHLFEGADVSTPIHELGHIALFDLPEADLTVIEELMAGGRKLDEWGDTEHETFARAFEAYVRRGEAPTPELADAFRKLAEWMRVIWEAVKGNPEIELDPAVIRVYDEMFKRDPSTDVDTFIPHRAGAPDLGGGRVSGGVPRASRDIGDRAFSRIPIFARNRLALMRMGMLNDDPRMLVEHTNRVVMLARANQIRETVLALAEPLMPDQIPDFQNQYVVKKAGRGVNKPLYDAIEAADDPEEIRTEIKSFVDQYITDERVKWEEWKGKDQLYVVDKAYVDRLFKNITGKTPGATTKPETGVTKLIDAGLDSVRAALLYLNPGFYTANIIGNATMMGLSDPRAARFLIPSLREAGRAAHKPETADPTWRRISTEQGRGPTSGGLSSRPPLLGREASRRGAAPVRVAETASLGISEYGRRSGRIIDDAMRVAAWKQVAHKFDYKTDEQINKLLDDATGGKLDEDAPRPSEKERTKAKRDLAAIRDEAEQLMLDFDSMTPFEKSWLTRVIFLYPFLKASAKWPIMFMGERPITAGLLAEYGRQGEQVTEDQLGPRPELPLWLQSAARVGPGQYMAAGSIAPMAPVAQLIESAMGLGQAAETGISRPIDYLNPLTQLGIELAQSRTQFGQDLSAPGILRQDLPMTALQRQALGLKDPSEVYADRNLLATALRSLRFLPYGVNEGAAPPPPPPPSNGRRRTGSRRRGRG